MSVFEHGVRLGRSSALVAAWLAVLAAESRADESLWNLPQNGTFNVDDNWFGGVPGTGDVARFEITSSDSDPLQRKYRVDFTNNPFNQQLVVEDDNVTFDLFENPILTAHTYTLLNSFVAAAIGTVPNRSGNLTVIGGTLMLPEKNPTSATDLEIAPVAGASGVLTVGADGLISGTPDVFVGLNGKGYLNINSHGDVIADLVRIGENAGSEGKVIIKGDGAGLFATDLSVGGSGKGSLEILSSGRVDSGSGLIHSTAGTATAHAATATVSNADSLWIINGNLDVSSGHLKITNGGQVEDENARVSNKGSGPAALVEVTGPNSKWTHQRGLVIGEYAYDSGPGPGTLKVNGGGMVENIAADATVSLYLGTVKVDGPNSKWINASDLSVGDTSLVEITRGGFVQTADAILHGGSDILNLATVVVSGSSGGTPSTWKAPSVLVGFGGDATLKVLAGGRVEVETHLAIGGQGADTSEVLVEGRNSELVVGGTLLVGGIGGYENGGKLSITGGARVLSQRASLVNPQGPIQNRVVVAGAGSTWEIDTDLVGNSSGGMVQIQSGGVVTAERVMLHGEELRLEGGALFTRAIDFGGQPPHFVWTSGRLGVVNYFGDLTIPNGGVLEVGRPSLGSPQTEVLGDYVQQSGGILEIEARAYIDGSTYVDRVRVFGTADLGGLLTIKVNDGAVLDPASRYEIMRATSISGSFANVANGQRLMTSDGLGSFVVNYGPGSLFDPKQVVLSSFLTPLRGDFNVDGVVDALDIDLLAIEAKKPQPSNLFYDLNGDGRVTFTVSSPGVPNASDSDVLVRDILHTRYGDADLNGQVFLSDLTKLATNYRQPGPFGWAQGNFNGSQEAGTAASPRVFLSDLTALASNWRFGVGTGSAIGAAVPEPNGLLLALVPALIALARRARCGPSGPPNAGTARCFVLR
jgi:T5SS/PEP-CTERM-associated repeat protein